MAPRSIPQLLEPYLGLPHEGTLLLITSVLGVCHDWLIDRYVYSFFKGTQATTPDPHEQVPHEEALVLLVSFFQDFSAWEYGTKRLGLDLNRMAQTGRLVYIDGLSEIYSSGSPATSGPGHVTKGRKVLRSSDLQDVLKELNHAISELEGNGKPIVLIIDRSDFLLAANDNPATTSLGLRDVIFALRERVHATILTAAADQPLIAAQTTTLEKEHAVFVLSLAHEADMIIGLRLLDTGPAKDVTGVIRITRGGGNSETEVQEHEFLYLLDHGGGAKVFERGQ